MKFIHCINFTDYIRKKNVTDMLQNDCILIYKSCVNATTFSGI